MNHQFSLQLLQTEIDHRIKRQAWNKECIASLRIELDQALADRRDYEVEIAALEAAKRALADSAGSA